MSPIFPQPVSAKVVANKRQLGFPEGLLDRRWKCPYHFPHALALVMAYVAILETHDPPKIHRLTGFPLLFVARSIFELSRSPLWQSNLGYEDLLHLSKQKDLEELNHVLGELLIRKDLFHPSAYSDLECEWNRAMGVEVEL